ncbi:MAG: hypothetical protein WC960_06395 [Bacteroidales bacterium]
MNENFKKQVSDIENIAEIAQIVALSVELKERVSTYNSSSYSPLLAKSGEKIPIYFQEKGHTIYMIGDCSQEGEVNSEIVTKIEETAKLELLETLHTAQEGLFISLVEACAVKKLGFDITTVSEIEEKEFLFKEKLPILIVALAAEKESRFVDYIYHCGLNITLLGHVTKGELRIDDTSFGYIQEYLD